MIAAREVRPQFPSASPDEQPSRISSSWMLRARSGPPSLVSGSTGVAAGSGSAAITGAGADGAAAGCSATGCSGAGAGDTAGAGGVTNGGGDCKVGVGAPAGAGVSAGAADSTTVTCRLGVQRRRSASFARSTNTPFGKRCR